MNKPSFVNLMEMRARQQRNDIFLEKIKCLPHPISILDIGGTLEYWRTVNIPQVDKIRIVLFNLHEQNAAFPFESVVGDARDLSRYEDKEFDIVFSNSVIGHVGSFSDQQRMAKEIQRVGIYFFLQTPNHSFPIDWRTLVPFFHFLPINAQAWCFERFSIGIYQRARTSVEALIWASRVRNIRKNELNILFSGASILPETFFGFTKSFIVHNFPATRIVQ